jgi:hypothetical protein
MKVKVICGAILATGAVTQGIAAAADYVNADGSVTTRYVRTFTGKDAVPFIEQRIQRYIDVIKDPMTSANKRQEAQERLNTLESGNYTSFIHQVSVPAEYASALSLSDCTASPGVVGETCTDQSCKRQPSGYFQVTKETWTYEATTAGGSTFDWVETDSRTWQVTSCPSDV